MTRIPPEHLCPVCGEFGPFGLRPPARADEPNPRTVWYCAAHRPEAWFVFQSRAAIEPGPAPRQGLLL